MSKRRKKRALIIPIFIPQQGCPYQCVYCQQEKITDQFETVVDQYHIKKILDMAVNSSGFAFSGEREVAFYGGTFTCLGVNRIRELLEAVKPYIDKGLFKSIRVSTRPDEIDGERLQLMKSLGVSTVELGVQSMDDEVLRLSGRGHTSGDISESLKFLRSFNFKVGVQLMPGLPGDSEKIFLRTIDKVIDLKPDMARLYPAIVIKGTKLAEWYNNKRYRPMDLDSAVRICRESCILLEKESIPVIRIGLMSSPSLLKKGQIIAGPWHSAFGFLVRSDIHRKKIENYLPKPGEASKIGIRAPEREIALLRGYKNNGISLIEKSSGAKIEYIKSDDSVPSEKICVDVIR